MRACVCACVRACVCVSRSICLVFPSICVIVCLFICLCSGLYATMCVCLCEVTTVDYRTKCRLLIVTIVCNIPQVHLGSEEIVAFLLLMSSFDELTQIGKEISHSGNRGPWLLSNHTFTCYL